MKKPTYPISVIQKMKWFGIDAARLYEANYAKRPLVFLYPSYSMVFGNTVLLARDWMSWSEPAKCANLVHECQHLFQSDRIKNWGVRWLFSRECRLIYEKEAHEREIDFWCAIGSIPNLTATGDPEYAAQQSVILKGIHWNFMNVYRLGNLVTDHGVWQWLTTTVIRAHSAI